MNLYVFGPARPLGMARKAVSDLMTGQRVTPGGLAITAWARSHLRCQKTQRVKVVGYLKRHSSSELSGSAKLTGAGAVSVEGSTDRNQTWAESDVSLGGENVSGSRDVWGTRLPDSKSHFQQGEGGSDFRLPVYQPVSDCEGALRPA